MRIEGLLHPLLLEMALPRLPNPPGVEEDDGQEEEEGVSGNQPSSCSPPSFPKGLAFRVPEGTSVVVITGPNTGGRGAYSPAPVLTPAIEDQIMKQVPCTRARTHTQIDR